MLVAITINNASHQRQHAEALRRGVERHGHGVQYISTHDVYEAADVHVSWSIKRQQLWAWREATGKPVLVMERGHVGDRMVYTSCGWNGLGRRGTYPKAQDGGARWQARWGDLMLPWRDGGRYALLIGQVPGDSALYHLPTGFDAWARTMTDALRLRKYAVRYRPHPFVRKSRDSFCPHGAEYSGTMGNDQGPSLADDLADAALCVTYNSTSGVEAVLAGIPTVTMDEGAMAWPMTAHDCAAPAVRPDRDAWAHDLAWTQWTLEELASGDVWAHLAPLVGLAH